MSGFRVDTLSHNSAWRVGGFLLACLLLLWSGGCGTPASTASDASADTADAEAEREDDSPDADVDRDLGESDAEVDEEADVGPPESFNVYYGYLHSHTGVSDGEGTPAEAFEHARDVAGLDFFGISDHDYYPDDMTDDDWSEIRTAANEFNEDGNFVAFWGFEWTSDTAGWQENGLGHITIVNSESYCNSTYEPTGTLNQLVAWLETQDAIAFFNHPGQYRTDFDSFDFTYSDKIVGMELWNSSDDYYNGGLYYDEALSKGWYIGAAGGQDNHDDDWGMSNEWRIAVLAPEKTHAAILAAFRARRFYSSRDRNLLLSFVCNDAQMGSRLPGGTVSCQIEAQDGDDELFSRVRLVRNGTLEESWSLNERHPIINHSLDVIAGDTLYVVVSQPTRPLN